MKKLRKETIALSAILFFALIIRLISINQSLWLDEATSAIVVRDLSFVQILRNFSPADFHPPLYYLLLKVWSYGFGTSEIGLRLMSVVVGLGTVYLGYLIGKKLMYEKVGLVASLFLATSGLHIYYSHEARMYSLATLFVTAAIYFIIKTNKKDNLTGWICLSVSLLFAGATYYLSLLILPTLWIYGKVAKGGRKWWRKFVVVHIPLTLFLLAWFPTLTKQLKVASYAKTSLWWEVLGRSTLKSIALVPTKFIFGRISVDDKYLYGLLVMLTATFFLYLFIKAVKRLERTKILWLWLFVPIASAAFLGLFISVFSYFRLLYVLPALYLILAVGTVELKKKYTNIAIIGVLIINLVSSGVYLTNIRFQREDWRGLVEYVSSNSDDNSVTVFQTGGQTEAYRYYDPNATILRVDDEIGSYNQVWLVRYAQPIFDPEDSGRQKVEELGYDKKAELDFNGVVVWEYENRN